MSPDNIIQWLQNPVLLNRDSLSQLKILLDEYPCFTVARVLYLKNLLQLNDMHFSKELTRTAIFVPDRRRLYYFIEDKPIPELVYVPENDPSNVGSFSLIDRFLHTTEMAPGLINLPIPTAQETPFNIKEIAPEHQLKKEQILTNPMPGQELIDSFLERASDSNKEPLRTEDQIRESRERVNTNSDSGADLDGIEASFPGLPEETFTETLAKIYLKQKRYDRALEIFRSLSLKYPKNNVYFADQIRFLEKLIINIKNN